MAAFKTGSLAKQFDLAQCMAWVARHHGKGVWRQMVQIVRLSAGAQRISAQDYYKFGLFRSGLTPAEIGAFVGAKASVLLNKSLSPKASGQWALLANKLLTGHVLRASGLPVPHNLAYYSAFGGVPGLLALTSHADLAGYLRTADLPIFGKPVDESLGIGAASYMSRGADGTITLGNRMEVSADALATQIVRQFPRGYLFQDLVRQHPAVEALTGVSVGALRVVTLWGEAGPKVLYVVMKLPAKDAMIDATSAGAHAFALIDPISGRMLRAQNTDHMTLTAAQHAPGTGASLADVTIPRVAEAVTLCETAHRPVSLARPARVRRDAERSRTIDQRDQQHTLPFHLSARRRPRLAES